mgnify:CR=1 FL=1|tara:strand:- start:204 stop:434 length:231 start_codon:yes stop_codon:yes gene_type:complete
MDNDKEMITSKIGEIYTSVPLYLKHIEDILKKVTRFDNCSDLVDSLEIMGDRLRHLDHIVRIAFNESYELTKGEIE